MPPTQVIHPIPDDIEKREDEFTIASIRPALSQTWPHWLRGFAIIFAIQYAIHAFFPSLADAVDYFVSWIPFVGQGKLWVVIAFLAITILPLSNAALRTWFFASYDIQITNRRILYTRGIFNREHDQIELAKIRDVRVTRPLVLRIIRQGSVHTVSTDRQMEHLSITGVREPLKLKDTLHELSLVQREKMGYREIESSQNHW